MAKILRRLTLAFLVLLALSAVPRGAEGLFVNRGLMDFSGRIEERIRLAIQNYLGDTSSRIVVFVNIKEATEDRKIASTGDEVDLGYIPIPIDLRRLPKPTGEQEVELYGLDVEVIVSTPRQDVDAKKVGRLVRRLLKGMNPEVAVRVNNVENKTREFLELERKLASIETRDIITKGVEAGTGGGGQIFAILLAAGLICGAMFFLVKTIRQVGRSMGGPGGGGGFGGMGTGTGLGNSGATLSPGGTRIGMAQAAPVNPEGEAYDRLDSNLAALQAVIRNDAEVFAKVLGSDGRDWNSFHVFIPVFSGADRVALEKVIDGHRLPLSKMKFNDAPDDVRIRTKALWLDDFVSRLMAQNPNMTPRAQKAAASPPEHALVQDLDAFLEQAVEGYRPIRSSDYPDPELQQDAPPAA